LSRRWPSTLPLDDLYAGTDGGGVFKSTDGASSWTAMNSGLTGTSVRALAINPSTPMTLYAGTFGGGVSKSTDGASNWTAMNSGHLTNSFVQTLSIDPSAPMTLYAGISRWRSVRLHWKFAAGDGDADADGLADTDGLADAHAG
jgi:hypothetical protein